MLVGFSRDSVKRLYSGCILILKTFRRETVSCIGVFSTMGSIQSSRRSSCRSCSKVWTQNILWVRSNAFHVDMSMKILSGSGDHIPDESVTLVASSPTDLGESRRPFRRSSGRRVKGKLRSDKSLSMKRSMSSTLLIKTSMAKVLGRLRQTDAVQLFCNTMLCHDGFQIRLR